MYIQDIYLLIFYKTSAVKNAYRNEGNLKSALRILRVVTFTI